MNKYLHRASNDVLKLRIFSKIGVKKYKRFLPGQLEFYRTEFEFCDEDSNGFVSFEENVKCQKLAEDLIKSQLKRQGWAKVPDVLFSIKRRGKKNALYQISLFSTILTLILYFAKHFCCLS